MKSKTIKKSNLSQDNCPIKNYTVIELLLMNLNFNVSNFILSNPEIYATAEDETIYSGYHFQERIINRNSFKYEQYLGVLPEEDDGPQPPPSPIIVDFRNLHFEFVSINGLFEGLSDIKEQLSPRNLHIAETFGIIDNLDGFAQITQASIKAFGGDNIPGENINGEIVFDLSSIDISLLYKLDLTVTDNDGINIVAISHLLCFR